jgi:hypothetical protein
MNSGGGCRLYTAGLPMAFSTENGIIFFWAVALNSIGNVRQYSFEIRTKILKIPSDFSIFVEKSIGNCASEHAHIRFAMFVGKSIGNYAGSLTVMRIGMCAICR